MPGLRRLWLLVALPSLLATATASEVGFVEDFSLARDRTEPLKQLIPGTEDYYYYHCLHYLNTGAFDGLAKMLPVWIKRHGYSTRVKEIRNRQALLAYAREPQKALAHLRNELGLRFSHQKEVLDRKTNFPTSLAPERISRETLGKIALSSYRGVHGFENAGLEYAAGLGLDPERRRELLKRQILPDLDGLADMIAADLKYKRSGGFGSLPIHRRLLKTQMAALLEGDPKLLDNQNFVAAWLTRLRPSNDVDWRHDAAAREAYYEALWEFAKRLKPSFNSQKTCILFHRLEHDLSQGAYDQDRFMEYLKLPRNVFYVEPAYLRRPEHRNYRANLNANYESVIFIPPVRTDEPLVREFLLHFLARQPEWQPYAPYISDNYLKELFAEAKIVNGLGDQERWYALLPPAKYQALKDRVDLELRRTNPARFRVNDPVNLKLWVKNVQTLIVKVFHVNALNYYRDHGQEIGLNIELDGLVPNEELVFKYDEPALRRIERSFEFPNLKQPGVYVVEFIGNCKRSRALVSLGRLKYLMRQAEGGHLFTLLDDANQKVERGGAIRLGGRRFVAAADGTILVPYSTRPGRKQIILEGNGIVTLEHFEHAPESYRLAAGIYVEREALLAGQAATVVLRPLLFLERGSGQPRRSAQATSVPLSLLEDTVFRIQSVDGEGIAASKEFRKFDLSEDAECTFEFQVPKNLASVRFILEAKVKSLTQNKKITVRDATGYNLNQIDRTEKIDNLHLARIDGDYALELLGKTGEARPDRPVSVELKHRLFKRTVHAQLQTDAKGRIVLGPLAEIDWFKAAYPGGQQHQWRPAGGSGQSHYPAAVHARQGEPVAVPYIPSAAALSRAAVALLEQRGSQYTVDHFSRLHLENGLLVAKDLPAGDYALFLKEPTIRQISLRVTAGEPVGSHLTSDARILERAADPPLQVREISAAGRDVRIQLTNASDATRVHVFATRFVPDYKVFPALAARSLPQLNLAAVPKARSHYVSGVKVGDEYAYVINRRYAEKFAGNMLRRPGLLLNPFALRQTQTGAQQAAGGEALPESPSEGLKRYQSAKRIRPGTEARTTSFANLDFLPGPAVVRLNLRPDDKGVVTLDRQELNGKQELHVLAADGLQTVYRSLSLPETPTPNRDLRMANGLAAERHFVESKEVGIVRAGEDFELADIGTSAFQTYDTLSQVYGLYSTLSQDATLREFSFILQWPKLTAEEQREKYSKYACHELSFFLYHKDQPFFTAVIQPYLANKKDKTFMDHWLLGADMQAYLEPWRHAQLNIVEKILLAQRVADDAPMARRFVKDLLDVQPKNVERLNQLFKTALRSSALETADTYGLREAQAALEPATEALGKEEGEGGEFDEFDEAEAPAVAAAPAPARPAAKKALAARQRGLEAKDSKKREKSAGLRRRARQFYRKLDKTQEWAENNYYKLPIEQQNAALVTVNGFWNDYAAHGAGAFYSTHLAEASRNFPEMMLALAVLDLPYEAGKHESAIVGRRLRLHGRSPMLVYYRQLEEVEPGADMPPILVSQNYFQHNDRYRYENRERIEKYVANEFVINTLYGCQVIATNPTSARQKLDLLLQLPQGAMPALNGLTTRGMHWELAPYQTRTFDYHFYFPRAGKYSHFPVHVAKNDELAAFAPGRTLLVLEKPERIDRTSWSYVSQNAPANNVLGYLQDNNLNRTELPKIAFRMRDKAFYSQALELLRERHAYDHTLWSYAIYHNQPEGIREYLRHSPLAERCGAYVDSPLLQLDPVVRRRYQHLEYWPLVNARAHQLGTRRRILNDRLHQQYTRLLQVLSYRPTLDDTDLMAATYYLLLQDRIAAALENFARVQPEKLATRLQYDYFQVYLDFYRQNYQRARQVAERYRDYKVVRWRNYFRDALAQLDEAEGSGAIVQDAEDRDQTQGLLAATEPSLDFALEGTQIKLDFRHLEQCQVNYYLMDLELLFSRHPFTQEHGRQFSYILPNRRQAVPLPARDDAGHGSLALALPGEYHKRNVLVEIVGGGQKRSRAYYANSLAVQMIENYGQLKVTRQDNGKPLPAVYVKVYARLRGGAVQFYKDGYTDPRGRFEYGSLSTDELDRVERFALLVMSQEHGGIIREVAPPKR